MMINKSFKINIIKNNFWLLKKIWKYTPGYILGMIAEGIIWGVFHSTGIVFTKELFDSIGEHSSFETIAKIILTYAVYLLLFWLFHHWYWTVYNIKMREKLHLSLHSDMFEKAVKIDLEKYDDPDFYNDFVWAMDESFSHAVGLIEDTGKLINRIFASFSLIGVLLSVDSTMTVVILLSSFIQIYISSVGNKLRLKNREELNPLIRKKDYVKRVFKLPDYAKELRISDVSGNLLVEDSENTEKTKNVMRKYGYKFTFISLIMNIVSRSSQIGMMILMLYKTMVTGTIGLGGFSVAVNSCYKMNWLITDMIDRIMKYHEHGIFIEKMILFMDLESTVSDGNLEAESFESLEIKNIDFSYSKEHKDKKYVLENVSLKINKGEKIAIVGYNGAGKTTLTKLIMRLYDPENGEILYNGKNIKEYKIESLRNRLAAVFQDYRIFAGTLAENVVGGKYNEKYETRVLNSLKNSTFSDKLVKMTEGLNTSLTREFDSNGTQLSGGEQQKVAIARAFFRNADLIVLDEPSSSIDPNAEYDLNKSISEYAISKTVIFISHRLSTTRHADRIYVFDSGKLIESGSHDELIAFNGKYSYMFNLQAQKYKVNDCKI